MNILAISEIVLAFICLYTFLFHFIVFFKRKQFFFLWFSLLCLFIATYGFASAGLYSSYNFVDSVYWQKIQLEVISLLVISFLWFFWTFFQIKNRILPYLLTIFFSIIFFLGLILPTSITLYSSEPKTLGIGDLFHYKIFEGSLGILYTIQILSILIGIVYLVIYAFRSKLIKPGDNKHKKIFLSSFIIFAISSINDMLIILNVHRSIYTFEYSFLVFIVFMSYLLLDQHMQMYNNIENMNIVLEEKVKERTKMLQGKIDEIKTLKGLFPICSSCKKIRDDQGYWNQIESYIAKHSDAQFSHGICEDCVEKLYGDEDWYKKVIKRSNQ